MYVGDSEGGGGSFYEHSKAHEHELHRHCNEWVFSTHTYIHTVHTYIHSVYSYSWLRSVIESNDPIAPVNEKGKKSRIFSFLLYVLYVCMYVCMNVTYIHIYVACSRVNLSSLLRSEEEAAVRSDAGAADLVCT